MRASFVGQTALITGAGRGIGAAIATGRNLAAELDGTGVTVNVYRPGGVDTAMQGWIRSQNPQRIGTGLRDRFVSRYDSGGLITAQESANALLSHLLGADADGTGATGTSVTSSPRRRNASSGWSGFRPPARGTIRRQHGRQH